MDLQGICSCVPLIFSALDMAHYNVTMNPVTYTCMCTMISQDFQRVTFWVKMVVSYMIPMIVVAVSNTVLVIHIKYGLIQKNRRSLRAQILATLTTVIFMTCWLPWVTSSIYYKTSKNVHCPITVFIAQNVFLAFGNMHCITSPCLYIFMRLRNRNWQTELTKDAARSPMTVRTAKDCTEMNL